MTLDEAWARAEAALPEHYTLRMMTSSPGQGVVIAEPPLRAGNRGPRKPRYVKGWGYPGDGTSPADALVSLAEELATT